MPKFAQEQVGGRQAVPADTQQQYQTEVIARPVATAVTPAASNLDRLTSALGQFMPTINQQLDKQIQEDGKDQEALGFKSSKEGEPVPATANPWFQQGFNKATWDTHATDAANETLKEYGQNKDNPDFNVDKFIQQKMQTDLKGVTDPTAIATYTQKLGDMGATLNRDFVNHQTELVLQQRHVDMNVGMTDLVKRLADPTNPQKFQKPEEFMAAYSDLTKQYGPLSITKPEMATALFNSIQAQSRGMNGRSDLFDVFYKPMGDTGKSLVDMNPALGQQIEIAKYTADQLHDHYMTKDNYTSNQDALVDLQHRIAINPASVTDEELQSMRTTYGPLGRLGGHPELYPSLVAQRDVALQNQRDTAAVSTDIGAGNGWKYKDSLVKQHLVATLAPDIATLTKALDDPKAFVPDGNGSANTAASVALKNMVVAMGRTGTNVVPDELSNLGGSVKLMAPDLKNKDATPPARFNNLHTLYASLKSSSNPGLVDQVFDDKSRQIMDSYDNLVSQGHVESGTAWRKAFFYQSSEGLEYMKKRVESPEGQKLIQTAVSGNLSGMDIMNGQILPNLLRVKEHSIFGLPIGNGKGSYPINEDSLVAPATAEAKRFLMNNEWAGQSDVDKHIATWTKANFVHDQSTNRIIQVQPGTGGPNTSEAFSSFTKEMQKTYGEDAQVNYLYRGNGHFSVDVSNKDGALLRRQYPDVTQQQIMDKYKYKTALTPEQDTVFRSLDTKARSGSLTLDDVNANKDVFDKARQSGLLTGPLASSVNSLQSKASKDVGLLVREGHLAGINSAPAWSPNSSKIPDLGTRNTIASQLYAQGDKGAALTVLGEGVANRVYTDTGGNQTIGAGYNLKAHAATIVDDFRKAGIAFRPEDVAAGKASITNEQAIRLLKIDLPRYENVARKAFDDHHRKPGSYDSLSAPEKSVLTDMAFQSGGNVGKFTHLFDHMLTKQSDKYGGDIAMNIPKNGSMVIDTNRSNLRLNMLLGRFDATLRHSGIIK